MQPSKLLVYETAAAKILKISIREFRRLVELSIIPYRLHRGRSRRLFFIDDLRAVREKPGAATWKKGARLTDPVSTPSYVRRRFSFVTDGTSRPAIQLSITDSENTVRENIGVPCGRAYGSFMVGICTRPSSGNAGMESGRHVRINGQQYFVTEGINGKAFKISRRSSKDGRSCRAHDDLASREDGLFPKRRLPDRQNRWLGMRREILDEWIASRSREFGRRRRGISRALGVAAQAARVMESAIGDQTYFTSGRQELCAVFRSIEHRERNKLNV